MSTPGQPPPSVEVPTALELQRAIASVTGVTAAEVTRSDTGRDRLRISLAPGEDPEAVGWSVAATLRERFGIALDPAAITARVVEHDAEPDPGPHARPTGPSEQHPVTAPSTPPVPPDTTARAGSVGSDPWGASVPPAWPGAPEGGEAVSPAVTAPIAAVAEAPDNDLPPPPERTPAPPAHPASYPPADPRSGRPLEPRSDPLPASDTPPDVPDVPAGPTRLGPSEELTAAARAALGDPRSGRSPGASEASRQRAAIRELVAQPDGDDLHVTATLALSDREVVGRARGVRTRRGRWRAIAEATLAALDGLTTGRARGHVDHVTVLTFADLAHVSVSVTLLTERGEETFLGAALVRDDPDRAVMRAALDAVNRRVEPWLAEAVAAG